LQKKGPSPNLQILWREWNQKMRNGKKINKLKVGIVVIFFIVFAFAISAFGRYVYYSAIDAYFSARQFYFSSNLLLLGGNTYTYDNWGGIGEYEIAIELYSFNNELSKLDYPLDYTITCESLNTDKITCTIAGTDEKTSDERTIGTDTHTSIVTILVNPVGEKINEGETVKLKVTARTDEPYQKEISCTISLYIKLPDGNTYSIEDDVGDEYAILKLVNRGETATNVTLSFDSDESWLDTNDELYTQNLERVIQTSADGYIEEAIFTIDAEAAKNVKFYKVNKWQDYSYPRGEAPSAITVEY